MGPIVSIFTELKIEEQELSILLDSSLEQFSKDIQRTKKMKFWEFYIENKFYFIELVDNEKIANNLWDFSDNIDALHLSLEKITYCVSVAAGSNDEKDYMVLNQIRNHLNNLLKGFSTEPSK